MSYDRVEDLAGFARDHGVTYPLLSDEGSRVIRALGLENPQVEAQNRHFGLETDERHRGLPYPGTFVIDEAGVVVDKWFEQSHRIRPSGAALLAEALHDVPPVVSDRVEVAGVGVEVGLHTDTYHPQQIHRLRLRLGVPAGQHVYVGAVPDGFTTLAVALSGAGSLVAGRADSPAGRPFEIEGIDAAFEVVDGLVDLGVPFRIDQDEGDVTLTAMVTFQTCTARECFPPADVELTLPLKAGGVLRP